MTGYLLDTNVLSEIRKGSRADPNLLSWFQVVQEEELFLSVLVLGEARGGVERIRPRDPAHAQALERWLLDLEAEYADRIFPITAAIADRWGRLSASDPLSVVDCLMAATALENDLTLVTRNTHEVKRTGVKFLNPFETSSAPRIVATDQEGTRLILGLHDGLFTGVRYTKATSATLWCTAAAGTEYQITLLGVKAILASSFTGTNIINAPLLYEARVAPLGLYKRLYQLDSPRWETLASGRYDAFRKTDSTMFELATSDGGWLLADLHGPVDSIDFTEVN